MRTSRNLVALLNPVPAKCWVKCIKRRKDFMELQLLFLKSNQVVLHQMTLIYITFIYINNTFLCTVVNKIVVVKMFDCNITVVYVHWENFDNVKTFPLSEHYSLKFMVRWSFSIFSDLGNLDTEYHEGMSIRAYFFDSGRGFSKNPNEVSLELHITLL